VPSKGRLWDRIRRIWVLTGLTAGAIFIGWSLLAYRANAEARQALTSSRGVLVSHANGYWQFQPSSTSSPIGLIFIPGALVDPVAYAPLTAAVAKGGHAAVLIEVPRRGAFGGAESPEVRGRVRAAMSALPDVQGWVVAGHSLGGRIAAMLMRTPDPKFAGLALIGTSHPRDFSLAHLEKIPVLQVFGTRDTVADAYKVHNALANLPPTTQSVRIDGGNHSQFGYYGFQPGDWPATISRETQQQLTVGALLDMLKRVSLRVTF
jgi:pimeloyl-ACP methyl ester carboxylesterase